MLMYLYYYINVFRCKEVFIFFNKRTYLKKKIKFFFFTEEDKSYNYAGLIITDSYFIIIKGEMDWLLTDSSTKPSIVIKENMSNLIGLVFILLFYFFQYLAKYRFYI